MRGGRDDKFLGTIEVGSQVCIENRPTVYVVESKERIGYGVYVKLSGLSRHVCIVKLREVHSAPGG